MPKETPAPSVGPRPDSGSVLAYVTSPHGFGHASRACGVVEALARLRPGLRVELFTTVPPWFFELSWQGLPITFGHHPTATDIGLVQRTSLEEDLGATVDRLDAWLPFRGATVDALAREFERLGVSAVACDISPLGLAAAERAGLPSFLVENFTWDWIYRGYDAPRLHRFADLLEPIFQSADRRYQVVPFCERQSEATVAPPVARGIRRRRAEVRAELEVPEGVPMVMVTMGGVPWSYGELEARLEGAEDIFWVVAGGAEERRSISQGVLLPHRSALYHPDLVAASDAVLGKLGYSTVAEIARAGGRFAYVPRPHFRESAELEAWVRSHLPHRPLAGGSFEVSAWLEALPDLLGTDRRPPCDDGAEVVAAGIDAHL